MLELLLGAAIEALAMPQRVIGVKADQVEHALTLLSQRAASEWVFG